MRRRHRKLQPILKLGRWLYRLYILGAKFLLWTIEHFLRLPPKHRLIVAACIIVTGGLAFFQLTKSKNTPPLQFSRSFGSAYAYTAQIPQTNMKTELGTSKDTLLVRIEREGSSIEFKTAIQGIQIKQNEKAQIVYSGKDNINYEYSLTANGLKEDIIISKKPRQNTFTSNIELKNLVINRSSEGAPVFTKPNGQYQFHFERPFAEDASGNRTYDVKYKIVPTQEIPNSLPKEIKPNRVAIQNKPIFGLSGDHLTGASYTLITEVSSDWLYAPERVYPISIDPTVTHNTSATFATGELNRVFDAGSGSNPSLLTNYQELGSDENTIGLWHFNETSDNTCNGGEDACDSSGNNLDGTATGTTINTTTQRLGAASRTYNGTTDFVTVADNRLLSFTNNIMSSEVWIKRSGAPGVAEYVTLKGAASNWEYAIIITTGGLAQCQMWIASGASSVAQVTSLSTVTDGNWHHIACVSNGSSYQVFVDGVLDNVSTTFASAMSNGTAALIIGDRPDVANSEFQGDIDELRISAVARTAEEIKLSAQRRPYGIYTSPVVDLGAPFVQSFSNLSWDERGVLTGDGETASSSANLIAAWNLNGTSGTTVTNDAGAGSCGGTPSNCDGTLTNVANTTGQDVAALSGWTANNRRWGAGAINFDGSNDYVDLPSTSALDVASSGNFSVEAWIKGTANGRTIFLTQSDPSNGLLYFTIGPTTLTGTDNKLVVYLRQDGGGNQIFSGVTTINNNQWHHVAMTAQTNGSNRDITLYVDGKVDATGTFTGNGPITFNSGGTGDMVISASGGGFTFLGAIDTVRFWGRALPAHEILSNYNAANLEMQTRVGSDTTPEDGGWEEWRPTTSETQIFSFDNVQGIATPSASIWQQATVATSSSTIIKQEGNGALKVVTGKAQVNQNAIAMWSMDETGGSSAFIKDVSPSVADNLTPSGTTPTNGVMGKARSFNGSSDFMSTADSTELDFGGGTLTISLWLKPGATQGASADVFSKHSTGTGGYAFEMNGVANSNVYFFTWGTGAGYQCTGTTMTLTPNIWQQVAMTKSGVNLTLYLNGVSVGTCAGASATIANNADLLYFSRWSSSGGRFWNGSMDEVLFQNVALTGSEIAELYRAGRDHGFSTTISSSDLSNKKTLPFWVAADRPGTYLETIVGESPLYNHEPDTSTVALWHLAEQSGNGAYIKDSVNNSHPGTPTGTSFVDGKIGKARRFNGTSDYISATTTSAMNFNQSDSFTVDAWVNTVALGAERFIFNKQQNVLDEFVFQLRMTATNKFAFSVAKQNVTGIDAIGTTTIAANNWYHVTGVSDGTNIHLYVDGVLEATTAISFSAATQSVANIQIGRLYNNTLFWSGLIDEVRVSNVARNANEIREIFEYEHRTHLITIDFSASLGSTNLIGSSGDLSFDVNATTSGAFKNAEHLFPGDKIVVSENYNGTEYIAQGNVNTVNHTTGATTVVSWDSGSTFPAGGYSPNATVFKWQREYFDITGAMDSHIDAITNLNFRISSGNESRTIFIDDLKSNTDYLTTPGGSTITSSTGYRYFQYRTIESSSDTKVSASLVSASVNYILNTAPNTPTLDSPADTATGVSLSPQLKTTATDPDSDYVRYKIELCTDVSMTQNCQTFDQTVSQTGWSGQNTQVGTAYTSGTQATYTLQTSLAIATTYYWRSYAIDPAGTNTFGPTQGTPFSFTTNAPSTAPTNLLLNGSTSPVSGVGPGTTPTMSAQYNDDPGDTTTQAEIQVSTSSNFDAPITHWDSGILTVASTGSGAQSPNITYAGATLQANTTFYWRIRFRDSIGNIGAWSSTATFSTTQLFATNCTLSKNVSNTQIIVQWSDNNPVNDGYTVEKSIDGGGFSAFTTTGANDTSATDNTVTSGHTYAYRVYSTLGAQSSLICTSATLSLQLGNLRMENIRLQ